MQRQSNFPQQCWFMCVQSTFVSSFIIQTFLCLQVCPILQRPSVRTHKNQQQAAVPASRYHARHSQLWVQRRWVRASSVSTPWLCFAGFLWDVSSFISPHRLPSFPEDLPGNATSLYVRNIVWKLSFQLSVVCLWMQGKDVESSYYCFIAATCKETATPASASRLNPACSWRETSW